MGSPQSYSTSHTLDGIVIDPVVKMRDLGVTIDCDMKFHFMLSVLYPK